jgi:3-methyladenine DNA glycosylase AlkC
MAEALKHMFDAARYRRIADDLAAVAPRFDRARFLAVTLDGLDERALMDRLRQTTLACAAALPGTYAEKLTVLRALAPRLGHNFVGIFLSDFVATHGLADFDLSLEALKFFTRFGSAEFAIRAFLERDLDRTLAVMNAWAAEPDEHVRRLASEGSRPRLPWGRRLPALVRDPSPTFAILTRLSADPSLYVRKSVANHLNDISKDHPERMLALVESWDRDHAPTAWIVRHAARTLIKNGHPRALRLVGVIGAARVKIAAFFVAPATLRLGETLTLTACVTSTAKQSQRLVIDYVVRYAKAGGRASAKVFKWTEAEVAPGATLTLTKRQTIRDFSTRRHHAGRHPVDLQVNGRIVASSDFTLRLAAPAAGALPARRRRSPSPS